MDLCCNERVRSATKKKIGKDPEYLAFLHTLPCVVCEKMGVKQTYRTEAAHVGDRGMSQKCPDKEAIPLCLVHHREGPQSQHVLGKLFWDFHGIDRDGLILSLKQRYFPEDGTA